MSTHRTRRHTPLWLVEGLDIAEQRRLVIVVVAVALSSIGVVLAVVAPGLVPPTPLVGSAVGLAALLLGYAAAVAVDAADLTVRGPRHVRAAGGELVAIVPSEATAEDAGPLASAVLEAREGDQRMLLGLAATGRDTRAVLGWADALGRALATRQVSVLILDLASGRSQQPGLYEVIAEGHRIGTLAELDDELMLARLRAGQDLGGAISGLRELPRRLPRDLDVLLVALPSAANRDVVRAAGALDHVLLVAGRGTTARVDLIAALDALETTGTSTQAILVDDRTVSRLTVGGERAGTEAGPPHAGASGGWSSATPVPSSSDHDDDDDGEGGAEDGAGAAPRPEAPATGQAGTGPAPADPPPPVAGERSPSRRGAPPAPDPEPDPGSRPPGERGVRLVRGAVGTDAAADRGRSPGPGEVTVASGTEDVDANADPSGVADHPGPGRPHTLEVSVEHEAPEAGHDTGPSPGPVEARDAEVLRAAKAAEAQVVIDRVSGDAAPAAAPSTRAAPDDESSAADAQDEPTLLTWAAPRPERARRSEAFPSLEAERSGPAGEAHRTGAPAGDDHTAVPDPEADTDEVPRHRDAAAAALTAEQALDAEPTRVAPEEVDSDEEDPLHTTAQLAILVDELHDREQRS